MTQKKNSQLKKKTNIAKESEKLRKLVHKCAKDNKTHCITLGTVFGTETPAQEKKMDQIAKVLPIFTTQPGMDPHYPGIFEEEHYRKPIRTEGDIATQNLLIVGNLVVTLETIHKVLAGTTENLQHIFGSGTKLAKSQDARIANIGKLVKDMQKTLAPNLKKYIAVQGKLVTPKEKTKTTYAKVTETIVNV